MNGKKDDDDFTNQDDEFLTPPESPVLLEDFRRPSNASYADKSPRPSLNTLLVTNQSGESSAETDNETITRNNPSIDVCHRHDGLPHEYPSVDNSTPTQSVEGPTTHDSLLQANDDETSAVDTSREVPLSRQQEPAVTSADARKRDSVVRHQDLTGHSSGTSDHLPVADLRGTGASSSEESDKVSLPDDEELLNSSKTRQSAQKWKDSAKIACPSMTSVPKSKARSETQGEGSRNVSAALIARRSNAIQDCNPRKAATEGLPTERNRTAPKPRSSSDTPSLMELGRGEELLVPVIHSSGTESSTAVAGKQDKDRPPGDPTCRKVTRRKDQPRRDKSKFPPQNSKSPSTSDYNETPCSSGCETDSTMHSLQPELSQCPFRSPGSGRGGTFVNLDTLRQSSKDDPEGIQVLDYLLGFQGAVSHDDQSAKEIVEQMTSRPESDLQQKPLRQTLLREKLPRAERELDVCSAAECLKSHDPFVYERAVRCLERILINHEALRSVDFRKEKSAKVSSGAGDILRVIATTCCETDQNGANGQKSRLHGNLLLLAACALLCHPERKEEGVQQQFQSLGEKLKKNAQFRPFYHDFERAVSTDVSFHEDDWELALKSERPGSKKLKKASLIQLAQRAFSLIHAMMRFGWDTRVKRLGEELHKVLHELHKRGAKARVKKEPFAVVQLFVVRCLTLALTTTFKEDRKATAQRTCNLPAVMAELIQTILKAADITHRDLLFEEIRCLLQHPSEHVRKIVVEILPRRQRPLFDTLLTFVENRLQVAGIRLIEVHQEDGAGELQRGGRAGCTWQETRWRGPDGQLLYGVLHVPDIKCLASSCTARDCLQHAISRERSVQHLRHLETLRQLGPHQYLLSLMAFQARPLPCFYFTEDVLDRRLLYLLIDDRTASSRLHEDVLLSAALQVVKALDYLNQQCLVLCDVTTYNMIYVLKKDEYGVTKDIYVKLADLGLTHQYKNDYCYENPDIRPQRDPGLIPIRWLPREALFEDLYNEHTMVYSFGFVVNELFTRGCQPFTQMSLSTDDILLQLFLAAPNVTACQWPCVPDDIFVLIRWCTMTKPSDRPTLHQLQHDQKYGILALLETVKDSTKKVPLDFPAIDIDQEKRGYGPERDVHKIIEILSMADPYQYTNLRLASWYSPSEVKVTNKELHAPDPVTITNIPGCQTTVTESLSLEFVNGGLQELESIRHLLPCAVCWKSCHRLDTKQTHHFLQERVYEGSDTLLDRAKRLSRVEEVGAQCGNVQSSFDRKAMQLCLNLARALQNVHAQNWLHCDLRAANILIKHVDSQVIFARIGRMVHLKGVSSTTGKHFDDNARWAAPEVVHRGIYSKESDIFSLVTTFWEFFYVMTICASNPTALDKHLLPLATVDLNSVVREVERGVELPKLPSIPPELEALICKGRRPDHIARPDLKEIIQVLEKYIQSLSQRESITTTGVHLHQPNFQQKRKSLVELLKIPKNWLKKRPKKADIVSGVDRPGEDARDSDQDSAGTGFYAEVGDLDQTLPKSVVPSERRPILCRHTPPHFAGESCHPNATLPPPRSGIPLPQIPEQRAEDVGISESLDTVTSSPERPRLTYSPLSRDLYDSRRYNFSPVRSPGVGSAATCARESATVTRTNAVALKKRSERVLRSSGEETSINDDDKREQKGGLRLTNTSIPDPTSPVTQLVPLDFSRVSSHGDVVSPFNDRGMVVDPSLLPASLRTEAHNCDEDRAEMLMYSNTTERQFRPVIQELSSLQARKSTKVQTNEAREQTTSEAARAGVLQKQNDDVVVAGRRFQVSEERLEPGAVKVERNRRTNLSTETTPHTPNAANQVKKTREASDHETSYYKNLDTMDTNSETLSGGIEGKRTSNEACSLSMESENFRKSFEPMPSADATYQNFAASGIPRIYSNSDDTANTTCFSDQSTGHTLHMYENRVIEQSADSCEAKEYLSSTQKSDINATISGKPPSFAQTGLQQDEEHKDSSPLDYRVSCRPTRAALRVPDTEKQSDATKSNTTETGSAEYYNSQIYANASADGASESDTAFSLEATAEDAAAEESVHDRKNYENVDKSEAGGYLAAGNDRVSSTFISPGIVRGSNWFTTEESENDVSDDPIYGVESAHHPSADAYARTSRYPTPLRDTLRRMFRNRKRSFSKKWRCW